MDTHRGHEMYLSRDGVYLYTDDDTPVSDNPDRTCGHCSRPNTLEGHDGCLGTLPGLMNACCGHGETRRAYAQFEDGSTTHRQHAVRVMNKLKEMR